MSAKVSLDELIQRGAHFGHQVRRWNPKMAEYIYGVQDGVHLFDLEKTKEKLEEALAFLAKVKKEGKTILLVGTKKQVKDKLKEVAEELQVPYVNERWLGGTITNFVQIKKSLDKLKDMTASRAKGEYAKFTKKERLLLDREIERLQRFFAGMLSLTREPDVIFVTDIKREFTAIEEARRRGITTVALVDTNGNPDDVDYIIPINDDASKTLDYVLDLVKETLSGKATKDEKPKTEKKKGVAKE